MTLYSICIPFMFVFASRRGQMNPIPQLISSVAMPSIKRGLSQVYCLFRRRWSRLVDYIYDHLRCHNPAYKPKDGAGQQINSGSSFYNSSATCGSLEARVNQFHPALLLLQHPDFCRSPRNAINLPFLMEQSSIFSP